MNEVIDPPYVNYKKLTPFWVELVCPEDPIDEPQAIKLAAKISPGAMRITVSWGIREIFVLTKNKGERWDKESKPEEWECHRQHITRWARAVVEKKSDEWGTAKANRFSREVERTVNEFIPFHQSMSPQDISHARNAKEHLGWVARNL